MCWKIGIKEIPDIEVSLTWALTSMLSGQIVSYFDYSTEGKILDITNTVRKKLIKDIMIFKNSKNSDAA